MAYPIDSPGMMTSKAIIAPQPPAMVIDCAASDGNAYQTLSGEVYRKHCGVDWPVGELAADHSSAVRDLQQVMAFSFDSCIEACSMYNRKRPLERCMGVSLGLTTDPKGSCWLKANIGVDQPRMVDQRSSAEFLFCTLPVEAREVEC